MSKKSFSENPALNFITQEVQNVQEDEDVQNTQQVQNIPTIHTQGKKGQKLPRINIAFYKDNLEYLQIISRIHGESITSYVNKLIEKDKLENQDIIEQAKKLINKC